MTDLIGRTIVSVKRVITGCDWDDRSTTAIVLDDGSTIFALQDEEGNGDGCLMRGAGEDQHYVFADRDAEVVQDFREDDDW